MLPSSDGLMGMYIEGCCLKKAGLYMRFHYFILNRDLNL